ncbi:TolC family protein [Spongiimicrobium salis]|uniref:TolC family protein n=1 Tax=Spongiimicrobium salis TaxID=1667022 RepID=UPI00374DDD84
MNIRPLGIVLLLILMQGAFGQETSTLQKEAPAIIRVLSFEEYLGYVKEHHPLLKQANLILTIGEANLLKARGGFDPKIEVDFDRKKFKGIEYYDEFNAVFKIPTWYGIEFKVDFEENTGEFLNSRDSLPDGGLFSAGVSFSVLEGFLINERMATLRKARFFRDQTQAQRNLLVNTLIFEASKAYFEWLKAYNAEQIFKDFLNNAEIRFKGIERSAEVGEKAAIDVVEARIAFQDRKLKLEAAKLKRRKAALKVGNFLWVNELPLQIQDEVVPERPTEQVLSSSLYLDGITTTRDLVAGHPKLQQIEAKIAGLRIDRAYKKNKLLPRLDLSYNFLTQDSQQFGGFNTANYKASVNFSVPIFLRKERGAVRLANTKLKDANFDRISMGLELENKVDAVTAEINSLETQNVLIKDIVKDYRTLLSAEERKFQLGESSLFLINSREQKLITASIKANELEVKYLHANASLYNALGISDDNLSN